MALATLRAGSSASLGSSPSSTARRYRQRSAATRCSCALRPPRAFRRATTFVLTQVSQLPDMRTGAISSSRRVPQCSTIRVPVYEPYARWVPALTAADTTGTYSANVGTIAPSPGDAAPPDPRGTAPIRSSSTSAASTAACCNLAQLRGRASRHS